MPSPFPGMDPFLEESGYFHPVHQGIINYLREQIQPILPEPYYAEMEERTWVEVAEPDPEDDELVAGQRVPDLQVMRAERPSPNRPRGATTVAEEVGTQPVVIHVPQLEMGQWYLNVYARHDGRERLVTTVEVLSISNKTKRDKGRIVYREKQRQILESDTHIVEIDLLRGGHHVTAVPIDWLKKYVPTSDYHACIKRFDKLEDFYVWPIQLNERLPILAIPLLPGDGAVPLDLQKAFDRCYDTGPYSRRVLYTDSVPAPALTKDQAAWVQQVLRTKGLLPPA